mmetsp:Transcript_9264/g.23136  ORF Transcript_9264/g.23136 Transcript_9264/m.23136 type:complete len:453 (-) Transcript_9264:465-1823(-)
MAKRCGTGWVEQELAGDLCSQGQHHSAPVESPAAGRKGVRNRAGEASVRLRSEFEKPAASGPRDMAAAMTGVPASMPGLAWALAAVAVVALLFRPAEAASSLPEALGSARRGSSGGLLCGSRSPGIAGAVRGTLCFAGGLVNPPPAIRRGVVEGLAASRPSRAGAFKGRPFPGRFRRQGVAVQVGLRPQAKNIDYFAVLGLKRGATLEEIKMAYKTLALKNHPDVSKEPNAASRFALIYEAYSTLSENEKNAQHRMRMETMPRGPVRNTKHYRLGEVVVHKREKYIAVVVGVDEICGASDEWVEAQQINRLPKGRNQRFYHLLPDLPNGGDTLDDAAEILCDCPAFLTKLTDEDEWPTLQTAYVPEDLLVNFLHTTHTGREGPVHNPLVQKYFMQYRRGRYAHDGHSLDAMKFFPVAEALTYCMLYGQTMSGPEEEEGAPEDPTGPQGGMGV